MNVREKTEKYDFSNSTEKPTRTKDSCPICGKDEEIIRAGRCKTCINCGWSSCDM